MSSASHAAPGQADRLLQTLERLLAIEATELGPALKQAADVVAVVLAADKVDVFVYDAASESLVAEGTSDTPLGRKQHEIGMHRLPIAGRGRAVEVFKCGTYYLTGNADLDPEELIGITEGLGIRSELIVPLHAGGKPCGVLSAVSAERDFFSDDETAFLQAVSGWIGLVMHRIELTRTVVQQAEARVDRERSEGLIGQLTPREREIAVLIARGLTNQQIADRLVLTPGTVANHVAQTLVRLGLDSRTQVATMVAELGLHRLVDDNRNGLAAS